MKKLLALLLAVLLVFSLTACFGGNDDADKDDDDEKVEEKEKDEDEKEDEETEEDEESEDENEETEKPAKPSKPSNEDEEDEDDDVDNGADICKVCGYYYTYDHLTFDEDLDGYICDPCSVEMEEEEIAVTEVVFAKYESGMYSKVTLVTDLTQVYTIKQYSSLSLEGATDDDVDALIGMLEENVEDLDFASMDYATDDEYLYITFTFEDLDEKDNISALKELEMFGLENDGKTTKSLKYDDMEDLLFEDGFVYEDEFEMPDAEESDEPDTEQDASDNDTTVLTMEAAGTVQTITLRHEGDVLTMLKLAVQIEFTQDLKDSVDLLGEETFKEIMNASIAASIEGFDSIESLGFCSTALTFDDDYITWEISFNDLDDKDNIEAFMSISLFNPIGIDYSSITHIPYGSLVESFEAQGYKEI